LHQHLLAGSSWQWQCTSSNRLGPIDEATCWRIRILLRDAAGAPRGWVTLSRRLAGERVFFQMVSLLDVFGVHFPTKLCAVDPIDLSSATLQD